MSKSVSSLLLTRSFYITLDFKDFKKLSKKAKGQDGFWYENYLLLLEGRLCSSIYRSSIISNMFEAIKFIRLGNVHINKVYVHFPNYLVPIMKFIGFRHLYKGRLF
jgi:ribosomal protein S4